MKYRLLGGRHDGLIICCPSLTDTRHWSLMKRLAASHGVAWSKTKRIEGERKRFLCLGLRGQRCCQKGTPRQHAKVLVVDNATKTTRMRRKSRKGQKSKSRQTRVEARPLLTPSSFSPLGNNIPAICPSTRTNLHTRPQAGATCAWTGGHPQQQDWLIHSRWTRP